MRPIVNGGNVCGIGSDIIAVSRIRTAAEGSGGRFLLRVFTAAERDHCRPRRNPYECYAARFAGKEAVLKALGTGLSGCRWQDVEILAGDRGQPVVCLAGGAARAAEAAGIGKVMVSLAHERDMAIAFAVALAKFSSRGRALF